MISKLFLLVMFFIKVHSFNFDTDFPIVFMDPTGGKNYFGYTVSMYPGNMFNKQWIRIGAPIANDDRRPKIARPGIVYDCQVMLGCKPIYFNNSEEKPYEEWKHGWMGGTMDVSYKNERVVVCGFRQYYVVNGDYRTMGACLWSQFNSSEFQFIKPLLKPGDGIISFGPAGSAYLYGQSQAGFSAHFPEEENEVILGAPGTLNWAGTPFKVTDIVYENPIANKRRSVVSPAPNRRPKRDIEPFRNVVVPDTTKNDAFNLFGYSVTSGYYYGRDTLYYASGSPKGNGYKGKVVIFKFRDDFEPIDTREKKIGEQIGEYFGGSLASGNINGDEYDDLLVGAPFFRGNTYNEGKIYLFLGDKDALRKPIVIKTQKKAGQFGAAIMFLGDMDNDGYGEVAVGAPYENGNTGSVYIYKGNVDGLYQEPCQKIIGKEIFSDLMGFGITISRAVDMDQNKFKDITVGAHLSGHAVLFRSRPIVAIKYTLASNPTILPEYLRAFEINICFSYMLFDEDSVDVTYTLTIDELQGRALIGQNMTMSNNLTLYKDTPNCENIAVTIVDSPNLEIKIPLQASLTYALNYPVVGKSLTLISNRVIRGADKLCVRCPVLDIYKSNQTFYETEIPFTLGCGSDNECHSTLEIDIEFPELRDDTLVLGSRDYLKMKTTVSNAGENAYSTKLYVVLPQSIYFRQTPSKCKSENASAIICNIANPLRTNTMKYIEFDLDVKAVGKLLYVNQLEIYSKIETTSNNTNSDTQLASLKLTREADITIYGKSEQETNYYGNSSVGSSLLTHTFQIEKYGVSSLERLLIKIQVPHTYQVKGQPVTFLRIAPVEAFFGGQPFMCNLVGVTADRPTPTVIVDENLPTKRRRRQVEVFGNISEINKTANVMINDEEIDVVANTTLYLNCTSEDVTCFEVLCSFGPYDKENIPASIKLNMLVNITEISEFAKYKDMVLITTKGEVAIDSPKGFIQFEDRPDSVVMSSLFINDSTKQSIALWIIILAVIIGLLLLMLLVLILIRLGFFKRTKKEELKNLKAAATQEAKILENIEVSKNQEYELETTLHDQEDEITEETDKPEEKPPQPFQTNSSKEHLCDT